MLSFILEMSPNPQSPTVEFWGLGEADGNLSSELDRGVESPGTREVI